NFGSTSSRVTVYMTGPSATQFVWASAYLDSFDTADGFPNVIGWEGLPAGYTERFQQFSFDVPAGHTFVLVAEEAAAPGAGVLSYSVLVQRDNIEALDGGVIAANDARRTQTTTNGASTCASLQTPGVSLAAPRYGLFTYQNPYPFTPPVCYTATVNVASGGGVWATAYGPSFSPADAL